MDLAQQPKSVTLIVPEVGAFQKGAVGKFVASFSSANQSVACGDKAQTVVTIKLSICGSAAAHVPVTFVAGEMVLLKARPAQKNGATVSLEVGFSLPRRAEKALPVDLLHYSKLVATTTSHLVPSDFVDFQALGFFSDIIRRNTLRNRLGRVVVQGVLHEASWQIFWWSLVSCGLRNGLQRGREARGLTSLPRISDAKSR